MLNKNLIKKSIATAIAGALLSVSALAAGTAGVRTAPVEVIKGGNSTGVITPSVKGTGAAGVVKGQSGVQSRNNGSSVSSRSEAQGAPAVQSTAGQATAAGSTSGAAELKAGVSRQNGTYAAPLATSGQVQTKTQADRIAEGVAALNNQNTSVLGAKAAAIIASMGNDANFKSIAENQKLAVQSGALSQANAALVLAAEKVNLQYLGTTVQNGGTSHEKNCREVWKSQEAAANEAQLVIAIANALRAQKPATLLDAQEIARQAGARILAKLGGNTDVRMAKLAGQLDSGCSINERTPFETAIQAAQASVN